MQNPYEPPTKTTKRSPKPQFHYKTAEAAVNLWDEFRAFLTKYLIASEMLRSGQWQPAEASLFPDGCYPPALPFTGSPAPRRPPVPPTRRLVYEDKNLVARGPIPVVEPPVSVWLDEPRARGHPV